MNRSTVLPIPVAALLMGMATLTSLLSADSLQASAEPSNEVAAKTFVAYWNAGDARAERNVEVFTSEFIERRGADGLARIFDMVYGDNGDIAIHSVSESSAEKILFLASSAKGKWMNVGLNIAADQKIDGFEVSLTNAPPKETDLGLDDEKIVERIAHFMDERVANDGFAGSVIVAKKGQPIFSNAYGLADRVSERKNTLDTPINLGSMNKMFTGLAITQLVAQDKLAFTDTVGQHLPHYPDTKVRDTVTVHQLLTHTSGLGSYWNRAYSKNKNKLKTIGDFAELFAGDSLEFAPGTGNSYSNAGPVVLGLIIEAITKQDYFSYIRQHVYRPAGMTNSDHYDKFEQESGKATGYFVPQGQSTAISNHEDLGRMGSPAGGGYASANDLLRFANALYNGSLIDAEHREQMTTAKAPGYGYLFGDRTENGQRYVGHNGGAPGINAEFSIFPELGYTVIVLANVGRGASPVAQQIRSWIAYAK